MGVGVGFSSQRFASHGGTNAAIFGIGEGSQRWASPVGVGAPCRGTNTAIFLEMTKRVGVGFSSQRLASRGGTNAKIFGITTEFTALKLQYVYITDIATTTTVQGGEGR